MDGPHGRHVVEPNDEANVIIGQSKQFVAPEKLEYVPTLHKLHSENPIVPEKVPGSHC